MHNAPKRVPFSTQKLKHFLGGGMAPLPRPLLLWGGGNTEIKHNNQYNFRLLQCAKIALRMHQNAPFSIQVKKIPGVPSSCGKGENPLPHPPLTGCYQYTGPPI